MSDPVTRLNAALEGRYAIERELGEGGMATVYLADDLKHNRKVALKVLKPDLAAVVGAERFLAEIETTANLTHPHILPLFDSGEADGFLFYVMPYLEGETLRDRIAREKQLPVDEAVRIATAVANALDHAHRNKVIHRDIKPANILLQDGEPVVADFGIALALGVAGGTRLTETGLSVGTPFYMSPEQATGDQAVGASTDTYALGSVLYEMLVGEPPYPGATAQAVLGKIIAGKAVSATEQRPSIPANVDAAVRKALEKLPADRFTSAQDFAKALGDEHFRYGEDVAAVVGAGVGPWKRLTMAMTTVAAVFAVAFGWSALRPEPPNQVERFQPLANFQPEQPANLLPDGSGMVFRRVDQGVSAVWLRRWDELSPVLIPGTEGVVSQHGPEPSPDGQQVAFIVAGQLRVVPLLGGVVRTLSDDAVCCQRWGPDGFIYYRSAAVGNIDRVPAEGGEVETVTQRDGDFEDPHGDFQVLPDRDVGVFMTFGPNPPPRIVAQRLSTGERKVLVPGMKPYVTATGHLLFASRDGQIMAATFDAEAMELTSPPTPVVEGVAINASPYPRYVVSESGELLYQTGTGGAGLVTPVWVERDGAAREIDPGWSVAANAPSLSRALSPDGTRLALSIPDSDGGIDVWVKQLDTGPLSRITFEGTSNFRATWSPDGQSLIFMSNRAGDTDVWRKRADGSDTAELVLARGGALIQEALYSPDGTWLVFREGVNQNADIYAVRLPADSAVVPLEVTEFQERAVSVSPDGRWLAFDSNRSGPNEIFVRPFPEAGASLQQVSADGGTEPVWAHSGRELFYVNGANELVAVQVSTDPSFTAGEQEVLFSVAGYARNPAYALYDVTPDDQRFMMLRIGEAAATDADLVLVQNFFEELKRLAPN